jgi:hypothetical protein
VALLERLAILITADAAGAISEMKKVAASAEKDLGKAGTEGSKLSANMTKVGAAMVGAGAGLLAVGVASADTATSLGREVMKLQRYTGMTAEEASKLAFAAKMSGVPVDSLGTGLGKLSKAMEANNPAFEKLSVNVRDSNGKLRNLGDVLPDLAEKFKNMPNGPEKTAIALQLFGRSGMDLMPFLNKGKEGIAELSKEAEKMGLVLSQDNIGQIKAHITSQRELGAALDGVKTQIGLSMIPVLDTMTNAFKNIPGPVYDVIGPLTVFGGLGLTAAGGISLIVGQLKSLKTIAADAYSGVKNFLTSFSSAGMSMGPFVVLLAAAAVGMWDLQRRSAEAGKAAKTALGDLSSYSPEQLKSKLKETTDALDNLKKSMAPENTYGLGTILDKLQGKEGQADSLKKQKQMLEDAIATTNNAIGPTKTLAEAEKAAADETTNHGIAAEQLNDILKKSFDPFMNAIDGAKKDEEAQKKLAEAKLKVFFSQLALNDAIKTYGMNSPQAIKAAQDLAEANSNLDSAQTGAFTSALALEQQMNTLGAQLKDHPELLQQNIDKINAMKNAHQIDAETAAILVGKLEDIANKAKAAAGNYSLTFTADIADADNKLTFLLAKEQQMGINLPFGSVVTINGQKYEVRGPGLAPAGSAMGGRIGPGMASGGRMGSTPHLVGELGPEIFWPDSAGTIVTAEKTKQMLSSSGDGGTSITNVTINMPPGTNGSDVVNAIKRYEKTNGTSWRN